MPESALLPANASYRSLALWLAMTHPDIFNAIAGRALSKGLGDWTDVVAVSNPSNFVPADLTVSDSVTGAINEAATPPDNSTSSTSWLSSLGSGIGDALSSVGNFLATNTTPLLNVASNYFKAQSNQSAAAAQQAVLQTQVARAQAGQGAAPITYIKNPVTGALQAAYVTSGLPPSAIAVNQPMLQSAGGLMAYPVSAAGLSQLAPGGIGPFLQKYGLWIGAGVLALVVLPRLMGSRS